VKAWLDGYGFQLKFVVAQEADVTEIEAMLATLGRELPRAKILLMPEGTTVEVLRSRAGWLGELCKARGYRYAPRLHVELYGNKRGT
jgi:7-carboxy-7-deazaguanine synthase